MLIAASLVFFSAASQLQSPEQRIEDSARAPRDREVPVLAKVRACCRHQTEAKSDVVRVGAAGQEASWQGRGEPGGYLLMDYSEGFEV